MVKLSQCLLLLCIVVLSFQLSCDKKPTESDKTPPAPIVAIYPSANILSFSDSIRALWDFTKTATTLKSILLPYNCPVSFVIANIGPEGSILNYSVVDDGTLGGFLTFTNNQGSTNTGHPNIPVTGSLNAGGYATITVSVGPEFTDSSFGGLVGSTLVLNIYTPNASNYIKTPVAVDIRNYNDEVQQLCGIWSGTWSGNSYGQASATSPVSGTWILNLQSVDLANQTASGTLTWNGSDVYWNPEPHAYIVNRTIVFNKYNSDFGLPWMPPCDGVELHISGNKAPYPDSLGVAGDPYGPDFHLQFSPGFWSILVGERASSWQTQSYDPSGLYIGISISTGYLYGSKSQ